MGGDEWLTGLAKKMKAERADGSSPKKRVTVRQLLLEFDYYKRGSAINPRIRNKLEELGLRTIPDFENAWFGETIAIELDEDGSDRLQADPTHRVSMLDAANNRPVSVSPDDPINVATTLMMLHDYSQLPVTRNERRVREVVSWKPIGSRLSLGCRGEHVRDCKEPARVVQKEAPLLEVIGIVAELDYVLVQDREEKICGIVTAADLSGQFDQLAGPFLLVGQIEGHLRNLVHRKFRLEEVKECAASGDNGRREVAGAADLTLGDYVRLLGKPERWERLQLRVDRKEFLKHLDAVREIRNSVMHFNPEGTSADKLRILRDSAGFFEGLVNMGAV